ncbi:DUF1002 domain-containing protein [Salinicoccus sesuvii]|uniref:DUF1002 domain-containing protein n=1 Tax=Salinicoccus sesuvii TaxID=868281 RepID=A0ABV7N6Z8_9STAP
MIKKLLPLAVLLLLLLPNPEATAATEWNEAVTVYGAALENDAQLQDATRELLGTSDDDKVAYVYSEDVNQYIGMNYSNDVLKSSIRIIQEDEGYGLDITVDESMGEITQITEETYKNALLTSGITDAQVVIGAAQDVTGESALAGIYKAYEEQGEAIDTERTQNAQEELGTITDITEENSAVEGFSQEQLNKMITDIKIEVINQGGNLSESEIRDIVDEQMAANGLDGILTQDQIDRIIDLIRQIQNSGLFQSEEAQALKDSAQNLIDQITSSDSFKNAVDQAESLGQEITESNAWDTFKTAVSNFFDRVISFFRSLFN